MRHIGAQLPHAVFGFLSAMHRCLDLLQHFIERCAGSAKLGVGVVDGDALAELAAASDALGNVIHVVKRV